MEPASAEGGGSDASRALRRYGPIGALVVIALVIAGIVIVNSGDDGDGSAETSTPATQAPADTEPAATEPADTEPGAVEPADTEPGDTEPPATDPAVESPLPEGVMSFSVAQELGIEGDIDWGERCDTEVGTVAVPDFFAPECYAPFEGDNGGETHRGVTGDTIRIVNWVAQDQDPILGFITAAIQNDDTNADDEATLRGMIEYWETYYETYGRKVELIVVEGSGTISDEAAARADAVKIDEELDPFMVWGGPALTNAFGEELAARGIPCISCGPSQTPDYYRERPNLSYTVGKSGSQLNQMVAEYVAKRLAGDPAIHAGDESMHDQQRIFGRIWIEASAASVESNERFEEVLAEAGVEIAESQSYALDPATLQESAATVIARMKEAGVTSVIFSGDPIAPREFTQEATAQNYFPEWIVTGSVLVDTAAFSRTYDQEQWAHAFGVSNLWARVDRQVASSFANYQWFHGEPPAATDNIAIITPAPQTFYSALQAVGPNLTPESFNRSIFGGDPTRRALTAQSISYGDKGIWPGEFEPDYHGVDDVAEIWWDPEAEGPDEIDKDGSGLWRYVDGGVRYKPGEIPEGPPAAFVEDGTVTIYSERPPEEAPPKNYDPLR
jgi:hypothetical protein